MTVAELISHLQTLPQDARVIYRCCSDWAEMEPEEVKFLPATESKRLVDEHAAKYPGGKWGVAGAVQYRDNQFCNAYSLAMYPPGEVPVYVDVVTFPGN